jgi:hypothetical protein
MDPGPALIHRVVTQLAGLHRHVDRDPVTTVGGLYVVSGLLMGGAMLAALGLSLTQMTAPPQVRPTRLRPSSSSR